VEGNGRDGHDRPAEVGGGDAERTVRQQLPHHRGHRDPAAVVAETDQEARSRLVQMRQVVGGEGDAPAPAMLPLRRAHLGEQRRRRALETCEERGIAGVELS
jgi:hypothetical protein